MRTITFAALAIITVALGTVVYDHYDAPPNQRSIEVNYLEAATVLGVSTRFQMALFYENGGLNKTNSWNGFFVNHITTRYAADEQVGNLRITSIPYTMTDPHYNGRLVSYSIEMYKQIDGYKPATMHNLKEAMQRDCGDWTNAERTQSTITTFHKNNTCTIDMRLMPALVSITVTSTVDK